MDNEQLKEIDTESRSCIVWMFKNDNIFDSLTNVFDLRWWKQMVALRIK